LSNQITLHISIIILASPNITTFTLKGIGHHIIDQPMFVPATATISLEQKENKACYILICSIEQIDIPYSCLLKLASPIFFIVFLENVFKPDI
jgi:hypothetical protein